jgi:hypothetical protein
MNYVTYQYVIEIHDSLIDEYGGRKGGLNRTVFDKTAAYLFHMIQNRPFVDGNKRTASKLLPVFHKNTILL